MITQLDLFYAERFAFLITCRNLLQKQVESITGIPQRTISKLIGGHEHFTNDIITTICNGMEISLNEFFLIQDSNSALLASKINQNGNNKDIMDSEVVNALVASKNETIEVLHKTIQSKDETIVARDLIIEKLMTIDKMKDAEITDLKRKVQLLKDKLDGKHSTPS